MPPLSLYIHIPWCVQKCPYCDFNSHQIKSGVPENEYIAHLLDDLTHDLQWIKYDSALRSIGSIFIGGGTPSVFSPSGIEKILNGIKQRVPVLENAEITMEANPGTVEAEKFEGFKQAGINRISVGVQSFNTEHLRILGRIHDTRQARDALSYAKRLGLNSYNADIMHGLPKQTLEQAMQDLSTAMKSDAPHISWYQLTIEPNTSFASKPPVLPDDDILWDIQQQGQALLSANGYEQYEISGYGLPEHRCQHNLNYWRYGDYIGIGCGAHGKITDLNSGHILRTEKVKHPKGYMDLSRSYLYKKHVVPKGDLAFEFFMNRFRLVEPCPIDDFEKLTFSKLSDKDQQTLNTACDKGLVTQTRTHWQVTDLGRRYLNTLLGEFV
ncbi:radical SAM family heme chaperone HemW [Ningiella sp. W23]|uniref:radical SAM family heme chaperone HemW n=1 Tax=Ningiella sp. W23 TaxID=3023715 RepID=UPI00375760BB